MLNNRNQNFAILVFEAAGRLGNSATRIADDIIAVAFPRTVEEAQHEGAGRLLRKGVIAEVKRVLTHSSDDDGQHDLSEIDPAFGEIVSRLKKTKYFVDGMQEYVSVEHLIENEEMLDDARRYMRRKGDECHAEADILDELYVAVSARSAA